MDISGKFVKCLPETSGEGKNGTWKKNDFVIEITNEKYPRVICFSAWGEQMESAKALTPGVDIKVSFDLSSREYNGKYFTDAKAWKIETLSTSVNSPSAGSNSNMNNNYPPASTPVEQASNTRFVSDDDLPF